VFSGKQAHYYTTATGHNGQLLSHNIVRLDTNKVSSTASDLGKERQTFGANLAPRADPTVFEVGGHQYQIQRITNAPNTTPYWVMRVPTDIIKNHDDIFNDRFTGFVGALFRLAQLTEGNESRRHIERQHFTTQAE